MAKLMSDEILNLSLMPITTNFIQCKLYGYFGVFVGQHQYGVPNGYIKFINEYGSIYEG